MGGEPRMELGVLADDLTGGMIVASMLEAAGVACPLVTEASCLSEIPGDPTATVLARKIRLVRADLAREEARMAAAAFAGRGARCLYYKYAAMFDSTAAGNIGPIAEALLSATGAERTVFCPAYIERAVTIYKGHLFVGPALMAETAKRFDPVTPAYTSNVAAMLGSQTRLHIDLLDHQRLGGDLDALNAMLSARSDCPFWVADAIDSADVARLAALTRTWPLVTGGDSLPAAMLRERLGHRSREPGSGRRLLPPSPGYEAVLAGSCGAATLNQLNVFAQHHPVWRVDLVRDGDDPDLAEKIAEWAADRLASGPIGVATTAVPEGVAAAQTAFGRDGASERADRLMADLAARLFGLGVRKFAIAGGETSGAVLKALGMRRLEVCAYDEELFGGYCHSTAPVPTSLVLKPGSMGQETFFFSALERMREAERQGSQE